MMPDGAAATVGAASELVENVWGEMEEAKISPKLILGLCFMSGMVSAVGRVEAGGESSSRLVIDRSYPFHPRWTDCYLLLIGASDLGILQNRRPP